ncbi:myotubularin-related protein 2, putative [Ichthyophthirius multifiliis]|uniref:Myotubularin-related protein 2, putative n=1 Tax=Ichthyophthirius multifiliis TaxID=5932 RepID=G0QMH5_ICHMU|nr:myotubularin-related protein 2, putative [Ichthyophthirius multifiliis]EGR33585.1 myotubularin-related protein 2, putative [Ichthyophthirius multifiliis]|eukprot:XP_004037571.1 myotubularin-related protein 2, putative [Ichthyophthirius multifiliis]
MKISNYIQIDGLLILTNYKLNFVASNNSYSEKYIDREKYLFITLGHINKIERNMEKKGPAYSNIEIQTKDGRMYYFFFSPQNSENSYQLYIKTYRQAFPEDIKKCFAFIYGQFDNQLELDYQGHKIYDSYQEFSRQGIDVAPININIQDSNIQNQNYMFRYIDNSFGQICPTYPPLIAIPFKVSNEYAIKCSRYRSRERLPALTYAYKKRNSQEFTTLWRCAQCKPGINQNRSAEDEHMLKMIRNNSLNNLKIYDARPFLNAVGQQLTGKGYEIIDFYQNCELEFLNIHNIHKIRDSLKKMFIAVNSNTQDYLKDVDKSEWFTHINTIISGSKKVAQAIYDSHHVVVHCSDGWDRTAQLLSLSQIFLDPYFRTIQGFEVLIEKEWISFGHQFNIRSGHVSKNHSDEQRAPIFIQFLDCVYQITKQFPLSFEFNSIFLRDIAFHVFSCQYGTFLHNSYQEIQVHKTRQNTVSLWSYINNRITEYQNPYYIQEQIYNINYLEPDSSIRSFSLWKEYFLQYQNGITDQYKIYQQCQFNEYYFIFTYKTFYLFIILLEITLWCFSNILK